MEDEVQRVFSEFWRDIVIKPNAEWDLEQIKRELYDYRMLMLNATRVYMELTGGRISDLTTNPDVVIDEANDVAYDNYS